MNWQVSAGNCERRRVIWAEESLIREIVRVDDKMYNTTIEVWMKYL